MNKKSIKLSDYFEIVNPSYIYIQIIPHKSIRNYSSKNIAIAIANCFKKMNKVITREKKKIFFHTNFKISYIIDIVDNNANFLFLVPNIFKDIILTKLIETWSKATIQVLEGGIKPLSKDTEFYEMTYKKDDALSLMIDAKENQPLASILGVMQIMKDSDRVMVCYNFIASPQFNWSDRYNETMRKLKEHKSIDKDILSFDYLFRNAIILLLDTINSIMTVIGDLIGSNQESSKENLYSAVWGILQQEKRLSSATKQKANATILNTQILVASDSIDSVRKLNNANSVTNSFRCCDEDNELVSKRVKKHIDIEQYSFNTSINTLSENEVGQFLKIPGRSILTKHKISFIKTEESEVPKRLLKGYFNLGSNTNKGNAMETYLEDEYNVGSYPLVCNGSQGSGKSTYVANIYRFAKVRGEGGVLIDYIKNNELTEEVLKYIPKEKVILLDYSDDKCMQGFAFNEISNLKENSPFQIVKTANLQVMQFIELINAINDENYPLQVRMRKYLVAAGTIAFCIGETSLKAIIDCLEDHKIRSLYISKLDKALLPLLEDKIKIINELDEWSKPTKKEVDDGIVPQVIGTKDSRIDGILDRVSLLKEDIALEYMFNKGSSSNINFVDELEDGKLIIIKMLQDEWSNKAKDIITTFFISKIWMATEIRGKRNKEPKRSHIAIDEIFQCPTAMDMLSKKNILPQTRKFGCKFIFTTQGLQQLDKLFISIVDAGGTFMLLKGTKENDFNLLKSKIDEYEFEDLRDMAQTYKYPSLNLVYYSEGYSSFITRLPSPI